MRTQGDEPPDFGHFMVQSRPNYASSDSQQAACEIDIRPLQAPDLTLAQADCDSCGVQRFQAMSAHRLNQPTRLVWRVYVQIL